MSNKKDIETLKSEHKKKLDELNNKIEIIEGALIEKTKSEKKLISEIEKLKKIKKEKSNFVYNKIEKPIEVKSLEEDKFSTRPIGNDFENTISNFRKFTSVAYRNYSKSILMWILLIILPMLFSFLQHFYYSSEYVDAVNNYQVIKQSTIAQQLVGYLVNWFITMPFLVFGLMIFPTFLTQCREDNFLKRFAMVGMSKKQIYWFYIISSSMLMITFMVVFLGPWLFILNQISKSILHDVKPWDNPWQMFSVAGTEIYKFTFIVIVAVLIINNFGYKRAMKTKSSKSIMGLGIGLWIFTQFSSISVLAFQNRFIGSHIEGLTSFWNSFVLFLLFIIKWMFLFTIPSLLNMSILLSTGVSNLGSDFISNNLGDGILDTNLDVETIYLIINIVALTVSSIFVIDIFIKKEKILSFETSR